ncbi:extracellular matrix protein 2-like [Clavelina lepadiformis]|uniref:LRRCT domain-containing protein n=1 Tax=Clavelina lepadiformis TaxID=159417 RepID=A0ABP0G325_CLALP
MASIAKKIRVMLQCILFVILTRKTDSCPSMCTCDYYAAVHTVVCDSQDLYELPERIPEWSTSMNLDGNYLSQLDLTAFNTTVYFEKFRIRYNRIDDIVLTNDPHATMLGLRGACNAISATFPRLTHVNLRGNLLQKLPKCLFSAWPVLKVLNIDENRVRRIKDLNIANHITYSDSLEELSLKGNQIQALTYSELYTPLSALRKLKVLDLSENAIRKIEGLVFMFMSDLQEIKLQDNQIRILPNFAFMTMGRKVQAIHLQRNRIEFIANAAFAGLPALTTLNLGDNAIQCLLPQSISTCVPPPAFQSTMELSPLNSVEHRYADIDLHLLRQLDVQGNRWRCDCNLKLFVQNEIMRRIARPVSRMPCEFPTALRGQPLSSALTRLEHCGNE